MARPLKVFRAHFGFYDTVVAAHSQKEALAAWGAKPGEFQKGFASEVHDAQAQTALKTPGVVLYRPFGTDGPYSTEPSLPKVKAGRRSAQKKRLPTQKQREAKVREEKELARRAAKEKLRERLAAIEADERKLAAERSSARRAYAAQTRKG